MCRCWDLKWLEFERRVGDEIRTLKIVNLLLIFMLKRTGKTSFTLKEIFDYVETQAFAKNTKIRSKYHLGAMLSQLCLHSRSTNKGRIYNIEIRQLKVNQEELRNA